MSMRHLTPIVALALAAAGPALAQPGPSTPPVVGTAATDRGLDTLIDLYATDRRSIERFYDLPWSEEQYDRLDTYFKEWEDRLAAIDFASLGREAKIDFILLSTEIASRRALLELDRRRLAEMEPLLPFRKAVLSLESSRRRMDPLDLREAATAVAAIAGQIKTVRERIGQGRDAAEPEAGTSENAGEGGPLIVSPVVARRTAAAVADLRRSLHSWFEFYNGYQPDFAWWLRRPYDEAAGAMDDYAKHLRESVAGIKGEDNDPLIGDPIGSEALAADLASEMIAYSPEGLISIAEEEFAWCEAEMKRAAAEMGFGEDWKAALAKVKEAHVPPGEQDDLVAGFAREAIAFIKDRDLVTIPPLCEETWRLTMLSAETQKTLPFAVYFGQAMGVAYPTDGMKHDDKLMSMRGNNRHFTRIVTPHELIPGHHLQGFVARRSRPYRSEFYTPFLVEGWAVYWEMRLWDLGFPRTPEDRIGMLFWRMHRCARVIVSLKFHLGQMSPEEMVDFLVDRVGHERFGATSEVRRFIGGDYPPLYQCGYMIGAIQLRALHRELVGSGRMTDKAFNDAVLAANAIPVELIRAGLIGQPLTPDHAASWKFAGERP